MTALYNPARLAGLAVLLAFGCSKGGKDSDFTPATNDARKALEAALNHWQAGNAHGTIPGTKPAVEVLDSKWKSGAKLAGYEILAEETGTGPRTFTVRLTLEKGPEEARYIVSGIDPLWVYREEDYKKLTGAGM